MASSEDELARTATAVGAQPGPAAEPHDPGPVAVGQTIGRYRLERELGAGGMGVVYVAFDPDLERRVALKVLRAATTSEAAQRLQREARAMARLNHPNVVMVHEVGSASGRDFVAMELIDGDSLADWLRRGERPHAEIVDAFVQAGHGLAAAHAAGIVHRDFKPHNVLRAKTGQIKVTDFGLARDAHAANADPLEATLPVTAGSEPATSRSGQSSLSGLTRTGSLLGTPAYMAPEQWSGGVMSAATDQFAFSVALWEALAGERPYPGPTMDELRAQISAGPSKLDASRLPRPLRAVVLRGLDVDPKRRWPSMDAMLAMLAPRRRGRWPVVAGVAAAAVGATITLVMAGGTSAPSCAAPAVDPATVWPGTARAALVNKLNAADLQRLDQDAARWREVRGSACAAPIEVRGAQLSCLDGILLKTRAVIDTVGSVPTPAQLEIAALLIDPGVCAAARPPRLLASTPQLEQVMAFSLRTQGQRERTDPAALEQLVEAVADDPCASSYAYMVMAGRTHDVERRRTASEQVEGMGERCEDERVRADVAIFGARVAMASDFVGAEINKKLRRAEAAVQRVSQADLLADLDVGRMGVAARVEDAERALAHGDAAVAGYAARGRIESMIQVGLDALELLQARAQPADLDEITRRITSWRELAIKQLGAAHPIVGRIEQADAEWQFQRGDVATAHARLAAVHRPQPIQDPVEVSGRVLGADGQPVAGATVVVGTTVVGDSIGVPVAFRLVSGLIRTATSGPDGRFRIPEAVRDGVIVAQRGDLRSHAQEVKGDLDLTLRETSHLEGRVELQGLPPERVTVLASPVTPPFRYLIAAPVAADGRFVLDGVPRGKLRLFVGVNTGSVGGSGGGGTLTDLEVTQATVSNLVLTAPNAKRVVHVVVRSTVGVPMANAQVLVRSGQVAATTAKDLGDVLGASSSRLARPILGEAAPQAVRELARPDDLFATMPEVPDGVASACALALPELTDPNLQALINRNLDKIQVRCVAIEPGDTVVTIDVPPWPRLE